MPEQDQRRYIAINPSICGKHFLQAPCDFGERDSERKGVIICNDYLEVVGCKNRVLDKAYDESNSSKA